jgi:hypothetical protein
MGVRSVADSEGRTWFCIGINPEPWAVGPLSVGRRKGGLYPIMGRNAGLAAYQEAIREEMGDNFELLEGRQVVRFYFWRNQDSYISSGKRLVHKNVADVTNMQKALEDALQGILFENDRDTWDIRSVIVDQGPDVLGKVLFSVEPLDERSPLAIPDECFKIITQVDSDLTSPTLTDNSWPPRA